MPSAAARVFQVYHLRHGVLMALRRLVRKDVRSRLHGLLVNRLSMSTHLLSESGCSSVKLVFRKDAFRKTEKFYLLEFIHPDRFQPAGSHYTVLCRRDKYNCKTINFHLEEDANIWYLV
jgi:hypothetical protein